MKDKIENALTGLETFLDNFFQKASDGFQALLTKAMDYTYLETDNGVFGLFNSPEKISAAARAARDKGYTNFDCLTPFPVHGLEFDMGLKRSRVPYITFFAGLTGLFTAFALQTLVHEQIINSNWFPSLAAYPNINSYPLNIGGKPSYSWPAMVPICFELTVLFGGHTTFASCLILSKLNKMSRKVLHPDITNDKFCLFIPTNSAGYDEEGVKALLGELGATDITVVKEEQAA